ncbi:MAG: hypothetical protein ACLP07_03065 [Terracidiphilus sp.]
MTRRSILLIMWLFLSTALAGYAVETPKHVFISASCRGTIPSAVLTSFREEIRASKGYQLATSLTDDGGLGVVLTAYLSCTEIMGNGSGIAAIAAIYGQGRCAFGSCHVNSYESTLTSMLCGSSNAVECGRDIFRDFDTYWSGPDAPPLDLK